MKLRQKLVALLLAVALAIPLMGGNAVLAVRADETVVATEEEASNEEIESEGNETLVVIEEESEEVTYEEGTGKFQYEDGVLLWQDDNDPQGMDCRFRKQ